MVNSGRRKHQKQKNEYHDRNTSLGWPRFVLPCSRPQHIYVVVIAAIYTYRVVTHCHIIQMSDGPLTQPTRTYGKFPQTYLFVQVKNDHANLQTKGHFFADKRQIVIASCLFKSVMAPYGQL